METAATNSRTEGAIAELNFYREHLKLDASLNDDQVEAAVYAHFEKASKFSGDYRYRVVSRVVNELKKIARNEYEDSDLDSDSDSGDSFHTSHHNKESTGVKGPTDDTGIGKSAVIDRFAYMDKYFDEKPYGENDQVENDEDDQVENGEDDQVENDEDDQVENGENDQVEDDEVGWEDQEREEENRIHNEFTDACFHGKIKIVRKMLSTFDIPPDIIDYGLAAAAWKGKINILSLLLRNGADIHDCDDWALMDACSAGRLNTVKYLIRHGADVSARDNEAMVRAIENGKTWIVKYLFPRYFKHLFKDIFKMAIEFNQIKMVRWLLRFHPGPFPHRFFFECLEAAKNFKDIFRFLRSSGKAVFNAQSQHKYETFMKNLKKKNKV
jgi:hypothetical protein